jgi:hypothetical protein
MIMAHEIALFRNFGLATPASITYSTPMNAFVGQGYTSMAGNTYFNAMRFADGILIKEDVGEGYAYTFLHGLKIYDLHTKKLLCEESFNCHYYSKDTVKSDVKRMLTNLIIKAAQQENRYLSESDVRNRISQIIEKAFSNNQIEMMNQQMRALGF